MATVSSKVKMVLEYFGRKQIDLQDCLNMKSRQSLNNKFALDRWTAQDLASVAAFCGCKIGFILPDGTQIFIEAPETKETAPSE